jgi:hypothetical protein
MDNTDKIKENIKKDLLKNIDKVVNGIYESLNNPSFTTNLEDTAFILEGNPYKELSLSDKLTGKVACPFPNENEENFIEVSIDGISKKIKLSNQIFTHLYKFTYKKAMTLKDIPIGILNILEVFEIHQGFQKSKDPNSRSTSKWLLGITLFGNMRFQNKINFPYITSREAKAIVKGVTKNLKNIYNVINGNSVMIDDEDIGISLFDHKTNDKKIKIVEK